MVPAIDWKSLSALDDGDLYTRLLDSANELMRGQYDDDEDQLLAQLPPPLRVVWLLSWLDFEVTNGSLIQYFENSHGRHARLAIQALRDMGSDGLALLVDRANQVFESHRSAFEAEQAKMNAAGPYAIIPAWEELPDAVVDELSDLTDSYWEVSEKERHSERQFQYLRRSVEQLAENEGTDR